MIYFLNLIRFSQWLVHDPNLRSVRKDKMEHLHSALRRLRIAIGLLVFAVAVGTLGYKWIEHTSWFDSYYMSLVTLSTVGFGEVIPLGHAGRVFTSFLILFNIGFFAYAVSTVTSIFADGELHAFFDDYRMMQKIQQLQQHTIVCGYGRHATEVCLELSKQQLPMVVIEQDAEKIEHLRRDTPYLFLRGDATDDAMLYAAGIEKASSLVLTLPLDANNLFVVMSARQINPNLKIISRLNNPADKNKLLRAGASHVVMPEQIGGFYMATLVNNPDMGGFFSLISNIGPNQVIFEEIAVSRLKPQFRQRSIADSGIQVATKLPIVAIRYADGRYALHPEPSEMLSDDCFIMVLGNKAQIDHFTHTILAA
jgi:voltage-gated potassium channel